MEAKKEHYAEEKNIAKEFYNRIGRIWCPMLNDYVVFNKHGFRHLIGKRGLLRPVSEQKRRFNLLRYAPDILTNPNTSIVHCLKRQSRPKIDLWIFSNTLDNINITIVVRQIGKGNKHFLSIYGKNQKSAR